MDEDEWADGWLGQTRAEGQLPSSLGLVLFQVAERIQGPWHLYLGDHPPERTREPGGLGGLRVRRRAGVAVLGRALGAHLACRPPRRQDFHLRPQQGSCLRLGQGPVRRPQGPGVRRRRRLPLVLWRLLRSCRQHAHGLPPSPAPGHGGDVRALPLEARLHFGDRRLGVRRGLRPRHHWRPQCRCHGLDRLELVPEPGWWPEPRAQPLRCSHLGQHHQRRGLRSSSVLRHGPLLEVSRAGVQAPADVPIQHTDLYRGDAALRHMHRR
mmetsp:Transcript_17350/g.45003  ORF Transcript_17350/g.45003 Transcript_17350/m.45003 type:complete len:267 (+) Transcript_17350:601-1401(+)